MRKVLEAVYPVRSFYNVCFRRLVNKHELTHRESFLNSLFFVLVDMSYNVHSGREDANSHYYVLTLEGTVDAIELFNE